LAGTLLEQALAVAIDGGERSYELGVRSLLAQVCAESDRLHEARRQLGQARAIAGNGEEWRGLAGQLQLAEGVVALAAEALPEAERHFERCIEIYRRSAFPWAKPRLSSHAGNDLVPATTGWWVRP
jgi:Flp pilus assembly protein TadD